MELHNLKPAEGSIKKGKRIGSGEGSKRGGTSTRGHKGQNLVQDTLKRVVLKEVNNPYKEEFLSLDLLIQIEKNI